MTKQRTFLVTGGLGFIGSNFVRYKLKNSNDKIVILDALTYAGNLDNLKEFINDNTVMLPTSQKRLDLIDESVNWREGKIEKSILNKDTRIENLKFKTADYKINTFNTEELNSQIKSLMSDEKLLVVIGSIEDSSVVEQIMSEVDFVVNYAAETHVDRSILNPDAFIKTDIYGTYVLLEALKKSDNVSKFLHISTDEVYGAAPFGVSYKETDTIDPQNPYSASKAGADRMVNAYNNTYQLPVMIARPSNNFGPHQYPEKLIPLMIMKALRDEQLPIYGDGKQIRDWLFVEDTAFAVDKIIEKGTAGEVYNISGRNERENIDIVTMLLDGLNKPSSLIKYIKDRPGHDRRYSINDSKLQELLKDEDTSAHWQPLEELIKITIDWYINNKPWWDKILHSDKEYQDFINKWYNR